MPTELERVARSIAALGLKNPALWALATERRRLVDDIVAAHRTRADALREGLRARDPASRAALAELSEAALDELRARLAGGGAWARAWAGADAVWRTHRTELMDDPTLDEDRRTAILEALDRWNRLIGVYDLFLDRIRPLLRPDGPTRLMDLASGHGGFCIALAELARREDLPLEVTATDLCEEYLEVGRRQASEAGLSVRFARQDALDLGDLEPGGVDVVTCTQALHHFPPGLVAVMFEAAARAATRGVVFIDGARSALSVAPLALGGVHLRSRDLVRDGVVSLRRCFVPEELELLARIGSWGDGVEATWMPPGHCLLRLRTDGPRAA